jgi:hypothetical protein
MFHLTVLNMFAVIGASWTVYFGLRIVATVVDVYQRWRNNDWKFDDE